MNTCQIRAWTHLYLVRLHIPSHNVLKVFSNYYSHNFTNPILDLKCKMHALKDLVLDLKCDFKFTVRVYM